MKQFFFYVMLLTNCVVFAQNRHIACGAEPGELYIHRGWYGIYSLGPGFYESLYDAIYRLTENGKKLTIQYGVSVFEVNCDSAMLPNNILADATPGVLYNRLPRSKDNYTHTQLWVSFDYGKKWIFREENIGSISYCERIFENIIYKADYRDFLKSENYGESFEYSFTFPPPYSLGSFGYQECEFFGFGNNYYYLQHTNDCANSFTIIPIDSQFVFGNLSGRFPSMYRGGLPGEVYVSSWFPGEIYKVSFSADTGHTFRHVFVSEPISYEGMGIEFMSDREPGVFYIVRSYSVTDYDPYGDHLRICIDYYRDYGETLVDTYCHEVTKDYEREICNAVTNLTSEIVNDNSILLTWSAPEDDLEVEGYRIIRNNNLLTKEFITTPTYLDENLPNGTYEYYVITRYTNGCVADTSNHVIETIELGIKEAEPIENIAIYPNPAFTTVTIEATHFSKVEIYSPVGQLLQVSTTKTIDVSSYSSGVYFFKVFTGSGSATVRRVVVVR